MSELSKRLTVYFDPAIHHALRVRAVNNQQSVSEFVNEAVRRALSAFEERQAEPVISYEALLNDLKSHGKLWTTVQKVRCERSS